MNQCTCGNCPVHGSRNLHQERLLEMEAIKAQNLMTEAHFLSQRFSQQSDSGRQITPGDYGPARTSG